MTVRIVSSMTQSVSYNLYDTADPQNPIFLARVLIRGRAGLASATSGFGEQSSDEQGRPIWTADGDVTTITDQQWDILKDNPIFKKHQEQGLVKMIHRDISGDHKAISREVKSMEADNFRPLNSSTIKQKIKVTTSFANQEDAFRV